MSEILPSESEIQYMAMWNWVELLRPSPKLLISGTQFTRRVHKPTIRSIFK